MTIQTVAEALKVQRANVYEAPTRAIDVGDKEERDGDNDWQHKEDAGLFAVRAIALWSARLEMCQWSRETLDKESIWDEGRSTSLSRW
jgi:hypothetical protein